VGACSVRCLLSTRRTVVERTPPNDTIELLLLLVSFVLFDWTS